MRVLILSLLCLILCSFPLWPADDPSVLVTEDVWPTDGKIGLLSGTDEQIMQVLLQLFSSPDSLADLVQQESLPMLRQLLDGQFDRIESIDALHIARPRRTGETVSVTARLFVNSVEGKESIIVSLHLIDGAQGLEVLQLQMEKSTEEY